MNSTNEVKNPQNIATVNCLSAMNPPLAVSESSLTQFTSSLGVETPEKSLTVRMPRYRSKHLCPITTSKHHFIGEIKFKLEKKLNVFPAVSRGAKSPELVQSDSGLIEASVGDHYMYLCSTIDTGSTISILSKSAYEILNHQGFADICLPLKPGNGKILTLGGHVTAKEVALVRLPFWALNSANAVTHLFYILEDQYCSSCLLLGADFISQYNIKLSYDQEVTNDNLPVINFASSKCIISLQFPNFNLNDTNF